MLLIAVLVIPETIKAENETVSTKSLQTAEIKIPMTAEHWEFQPGKAEFLNYKGVSSMKVSARTNPVVLKDFNFADGTIEFDVAAERQTFFGIYFRRRDKNESECFYFRNLASRNPSAVDAVQYTPIIRGINLWDLLPHFQGDAKIKLNDWNHVKLVVSGMQMLVYVNDLTQPALEIPRLEGDVTEGTLAFDGIEAYLANLVIKPNEVEDLSPKEGFDPTHSDPRYLRNWQVNKPTPLPEGQELFAGGLAKADSSWENIEAERRGLINLTRKFTVASGRNPWELERKVVLLKATVNSKTAQKKLLRLGFSDEVWVFLNKKTVFVDKNIYSQGMRKTPDGRISIENAAFDLVLNQGENELLIGIATNFYGWGIVARLESMEGLEIINPK